MIEVDGITRGSSSGNPGEGDAIVDFFNKNTTYKNPKT